MSDELREALTDLISLCERKIYPQPDKPNSDWMRVQAAKAALAQPQNDAEAVLSFLDELADNASPGKRKELNPILIGGSAKLYADGLRASLPRSATDSGQSAAARIGDSVLGWMVERGLLDAENEYDASDVVGALNDLAPVPDTAPPSPERMREALGALQYALDYGYMKNDEAWKKCSDALKALRAGDNHASEPTSAFKVMADQFGMKTHASDGKESEGGVTPKKPFNETFNAETVLMGSFFPSDPNPPDREAIARIIDPVAFDTIGIHATSKRRIATEKADRIIALRGSE